MPHCSKLIAVGAVLLTQIICGQIQAEVLPEPELVSKQTLEGRQVIRYQHASRTQWGYTSEEKAIR